MTSTVTSATVSTVSSLSTTSSTVLFASLGLIVAFTLLLLLIQKEIFCSSSHPFAKTMARILNVGIVPLVMAFGVTAVVSVINLLS